MKPQGLTGTTIRIILPSEVYEPSLGPLTSFWKTAFTRYGVDQQQIDNIEFARNHIPNGVPITSR